MSIEQPYYPDFQFIVNQDKGDKFANLGYISAGYVGIWLVGGLATSFYVRAKYDDGDKDKNYYCW